MKPIITTLLFAMVSIHTAQARDLRKKIHILPDAPGWEYLGKYDSSAIKFEKADGLNLAIQLGERNLNWLKYMNSFREDGNKIQLTKPGSLTGIPIEDPKAYSPETVQAEYDSIKNDMPAEMKAVLYSTSSNLPQNPPVDLDTYAKWANKVDKNYQTAVRWKMMVPWLSYLEESRVEDMRGYYFLTKKTENVENFLRSFDSLSADKKKEVHTWLEQMCMNTDGLNNTCSTKVDAAISAHQVYEFYAKYLPKSQRIWDSYFSLHNPRTEIEWSAKNPNKMAVPFEDPRDMNVFNFLKVNIEDEWKWDNWHLNLDFLSSADIHVEWEPGSVPHVNGMGGNTITMDKNAPLTEWDVQWTIRHEFGHVLGFADCYIEFYDRDQKAIVTYQFDVTNLMCARSGRMQKQHYETLKANYYH